MKIIIQITMLFVGILVLSSCNSGSTQSQSNSTLPTLQADSLNLIFVQSLESNGANLSISGYNHSLLLGQQLTQITNYNINSIYALMPESQLINDFPNIAPLQSIENYALLNTQGIEVILPDSADEIAQIVASVIAANLTGNFVFTLPANLINQTLTIMSVNPSLYFSFTPITNINQYIILTMKYLQSASAVTYNDGITPASTFPQVVVQTGAPCDERSVTYTFSNPPANINRNETVYLIRHVEAHPVQNFENGNYVCQGQWRAIAYPPILYQKMGGLPNLLYSSDPAESDENPSVTGDYIRTSLTANTFAMYYDMPLSLVPANQFVFSNYESMAQFFFTNGQFDNQKILVAWEHDAINNMVDYLIESIYNQPLPPGFPTWGYDDYDTIWKVRLESNGDMVFSNSCEGIATVSLPLACPSF